MPAATASFELERFTWADGAFEVTGVWTAAAETQLGRARLIAEPGGRRLPARPSATVSAGPDGVRFQARFPCKQPPQASAAQLEVGGELVIELPAPETASKGSAVASAKQAERGRLDADELESLVAEARELRDQLRMLLEEARQERSVPPPVSRVVPRTPRRAAIRAALERPREPRTVLDLGQPAATQWLAYALAAALVLLIVVLLALIL